MLSIRETNKLSLAAISIGYSKDNAVLRKLLENSMHHTFFSKPAKYVTAYNANIKQK